MGLSFGVLARRRDRGHLPPPARQARPRRRRRHQGERSPRPPTSLICSTTAPAVVERRRWHDPAKWAPDYDAMSDDALVAHARNRDALCLYAWDPYMHNPRLKRWLPRIAVPTLALWGASDGVVKPAYGRAYSALIPGARFEVIEAAGHHPEIEQSVAFAERVVAFLRQ